MSIRICLLLLLAALPKPLLAQQENAPAAEPFAPSWVQMIDQGGADPRLAGIQMPRGIKVEIVTAEPLDRPTQAIAFDEDGTLLVLEANQPEGAGRLLRLSAGGATSNFDTAEMLMNDLDRPAGLAAGGGWIYWTSRGRVLRRRPYDAGRLKTLQDAAADKQGPATKAAAEGRWIEQVLVRGLAADAPFEASQLLLSADGWLYVSCGSGDTRAEGWDGSRVTILRSGCIVRMRPDGSRLEEFARGLMRPRQIAIEPLGQVFAADRDWSPAGELQGLRLIHALAGGDYGWQHAGPASPGPKDATAARGIPHPLRAAAGGERPGTLPPIFRAAGGGGDLFWWDSVSFPEFCQGGVLAVQGSEHRVQAFGLGREAASFRVESQYDLLVGGDDFHPAAAVSGPDGGLYVADRAAGKGRILRLSWGGTDDAPAVALGQLDAWSKLSTVKDAELPALLESSHGADRRRVIAEVVARGNFGAALSLMADTSKPPAARAAALAATSQNMDAAAREAIAGLLADENTELSRLAAEALGNELPSKPEELEEIGETIKGALSTATDPLLIRALQRTLGKLAAAAKSIELAEWGFEATSVTHGPKMSRVVFDGHVRALELAPGAAKELLLDNLDVALNLPEAEPLERQRLKEFVTLTAEAMRTGELTEFLDALLNSEPNLFVRLEAPLEARLLACYRNIVSDPPINADAVATWLDKNPGGPVEVEVAALETLSLVGTTKAGYAEKLADHLLAKPADAVLVARSFVAGRLDRSLLPRIKMALAKHAANDSAGEVAAVLKQLETIKPPAPAGTDRD